MVVKNHHVIGFMNFMNRYNSKKEGVWERENWFFVPMIIMIWDDVWWTTWSPCSKLGTISTTTSHIEHGGLREIMQEDSTKGMKICFLQTRWDFVSRKLNTNRNVITVHRYGSEELMETVMLKLRGNKNILSDEGFRTKMMLLEMKCLCRSCSLCSLYLTLWRATLLRGQCPTL